MTTRSHITVVEGETPAQDPVTEGEIAPEQAHTTEEAWDESDDWAEQHSSGRSEWLVPALALLVMAGWSAVFLWANMSDIQSGLSLKAGIDLIVTWAVPVALVLIIWLIAMRNSRREAARFGDVANRLSVESTQLEARLATINRELSLAREFLGSQSRDLEFLGRSATERISEHADRLQSLVRDNGAQVDAIAQVSTTALDNMDKLRDNLPVIANSARDVSNQIGSAGRTAQEQLDSLVEGFERLNEFGEASERQVLSLRERVDEVLQSFEAQASQMADIADTRFADLRDNSDLFRAELETREIDALAAIRARSDALRAELAKAQQAVDTEEEMVLAVMQKRMAVMHEKATETANQMRQGEADALAAWNEQIHALNARLVEVIKEIRSVDELALEASKRKLAEVKGQADSFKSTIAEHAAQFDAEATERRDTLIEIQQVLVDDMNARLHVLDQQVAERREQHRAQIASLSTDGEALERQAASITDAFTIAADQGREAQGALTEGVASLNAVLSENRESLDGTDMAVSALTDASVRLLELLQASVHQTRDDLPAAMQASQDRLTGVEQRANEIHALLNQATQSGDNLVENLESIEVRTNAAVEGFASFHEEFGKTAAGQIEDVERLRESVAALGSESQILAEKVQSELRIAISALQLAAKDSLNAIEEEQAGRVAAIAEKVGSSSADAIVAALTEQTEAALAQLDEAREKSTSAARESAKLMRDQLAKVNELTANLEARISAAREQSEQPVDGDFSRRVALITESLNSSSIDIAKAMSTDVTDTAWAGYLRGDRGIFTRRAVRLLENTQAREIAELYDADPNLREHINRYIHDFEGMLRTVLSTRDGHAISVTLLSSDMGKLYVALAQALERLRN